MTDLTQISHDVLRLRVQADTAAADVSRLRQTVSVLEKEESLADLSASLLRTMIDAEVTQSVKAVEELLTEGLRSVFTDQDLSVRADIDISHGKVAVEFVTIQRHPDGSVTEGASRDAYGGAVTTVQSLLLRVLVTLRRGLRPVLFLDETLPAFDANYVTNMANFLHALSQKLGFDMLLVSHNPAMIDAAECAYRIVNTDGKASFKKIRGG